MTRREAILRVLPTTLSEAVVAQVDDGGRFAALVASADDDGSTTLRALVAMSGRINVVETSLQHGQTSYPALTPLLPGATWYEREIHDLFGVEPSGHPRLDPLVLPLAAGAPRPRPGAHVTLEVLPIDTSPLPVHTRGEGVFTIPYGPVRSGIFESVEYLVETTGEEIPHVRARVYHKHRGLEHRFEHLGVDDAVLLAERVEGTCSVAHALAFCGAVESLAGVDAPRPAQLLRVVHAELERIVVHLDSVIRHTEGAGQAIAYARLSRHKEELLRLRARMCGHRFGRGVVVPGGVSGPPQVDPGIVLAQVGPLEEAVFEDTRALMATASFLDRLRGTGPLAPASVTAFGALGPVARGSGLVDDVRTERPYGAYRYLGFEVARGFDEGDALARQRVRLVEIAQAFHLVRQALDELTEEPQVCWQEEVGPVSGLAVSSVEAPQGELIYLVEVDDGRLVRVKPRCASFHNLALFPQAFCGDIFTDFVFIEASFGLSIAGVAG
jgi:formate hydrogenlyase subunit 5